MKGLHWDDDTHSLQYDLWSAQQEAIEDFYFADSDITDFRAGYRAGKSILGARAVVNGAWDKNESRWLVMAESYKEGQRTTFEMIFKNLPEYDGKDPESSPLVDNYHKQEGELRLINGSVIVFAYAGKVDGVKGDEFSGAWMDEVAFYNDLYQVTDMVLTRLTADTGPLSILWTTTTNPNNPFNDYYYITEERIHPETEEDHPWLINCVQANMLDNPFVGDEQKEKFKRRNSTNAEQAIRGGFATVGGQVYPMFSEEYHVVDYKDVEADLYDDFRVYGYDSGWDDPRVVLEFGMTTMGQFVLLDEFYRHESTIEDAIDWLKGKPSGVLVSEHEPEHVAKLRQKVDGLRVVKANKSIDDGIESVQEQLKIKDSGQTGVMFVRDRATETIKEIRSYTKEVIGTSRADDHCMDCLRYVIHTKTPSPETSKSLTTNSTKDTIDNNNTNPDFTPDQNRKQQRNNIKNRRRNRR